MLDLVSLVLSLVVLDARIRLEGDQIPEDPGSAGQERGEGAEDGAGARQVPRRGLVSASGRAQVIPGDLHSERCAWVDLAPCLAHQRRDADRRVIVEATDCLGEAEQLPVHLREVPHADCPAVPAGPGADQVYQPPQVSQALCGTMRQQGIGAVEDLRGQPQQVDELSGV